MAPTLTVAVTGPTGTFGSGLMPLLFAITGLTVWWKRRRTREATGSADTVGALAPPAAE